MKAFSLLPILIAGLLLPLGAHAAARADLPKGVHRAIFLGASITHAGGFAADIEAYFISRYPERKIEFINAGLPSETVSGLSEPGHAGGAFPRPDLHERLGRVLEQTKPDLVFVADYGVNDGLYMPFDEGRFAKFKEGAQWLHDEVKKAGAQLIWIDPPTFDGKMAHNPEYEKTLAHYVAWLLARRKDGWTVIDLNGPMNAYLAEQRKTNPDYAYGSDGVHPNDFGHWFIARQVLEFLGAADIRNADSAEAMLVPNPHANEILALTKQKEETLRNAWLTATKYKRPGLPQGLPLDEATEKADQLDKQIRTLVTGG